MKSRFTTEPTSPRNPRPLVAENEARDLLTLAGELDHHGQHMSVEELAAMENLYPEGGARLESLKAGLLAFVSSSHPWWICAIGGVTHPKGLWRFGNINGAKRLHIVNPPGYGQDGTRMALCGVVVDAWVDNRTTPLCSNCRKIMERGD